MLYCNSYNYLSLTIPDEQAAIIRPSTFKLGLSNFTNIHPNIPPIKKVSPTLTGINHLYKSEINKLIP